MQVQKINLYRHIAKAAESKTWVTWKRFWSINLFLFGFFVLLSLGSLADRHYLEVEKVQLTQQINLLQKKFIAIRDTFPTGFFSQDVGQSINQLQKNLASEEKVLNSIRNATPFSAHLLTLARVIVPNVWLTQIEITKGGMEMTLKGNSIGMDALQRFLAALLREKIYAGYTLDVKNIENQSKNNMNNKLTFEITIAKKAA